METQCFWRDPALPFAESRRAQDSSACYRQHTHSWFSVGAVDAGQSNFNCRGHETLLSAGDVVLIPANEPHACNPQPDASWAYQMLYLDEDWLHGLLDELPRKTPCSLPPVTILSAARRPHQALSRLNARLFSHSAVALKEIALVEFAVTLFAPGIVQCAPPTIALQRLTDVQAMIAARCTETLSLQQLAEAAGLSRYHFVRAFRQATGMTPHAWQLDARINLARRRLDEGQPLASLALELGFADQSHFQRAFKQRVAVTPRQYQRNIVQESRA